LSLPNAGSAVALIDRLIHHADVIAIEGESYRLREAEQALKKKGAPKPRPPKGERRDVHFSALRQVRQQVQPYLMLYTVLDHCFGPITAPSPTT
jgi:hypothetical protein